MSEVMITVVGNVATDPRLDKNKNGDAFASFRLACNGARYDARTRSWVDDDTSFYTVYCWRSPLADNIKASLRKGDPVVVHGRIRNREWRDSNNVVRVSPEITARSLGHDLYRGTSTFTKVSRQPILPEDDDAVDSVRAAYFTAEDQHGVVDQRTGEIVSGLTQFAQQRPAHGVRTTNGVAAGGDRPAGPAAVADRPSAGDRTPADDRLPADHRLPADDRSMPDDRTTRSSKTAPGAEAAAAAAPVAASAPAQAGGRTDALEEGPPTPRSGSRARREKAGLPG